MSLMTAKQVHDIGFRAHRLFGLFGRESYDADQVYALLDGSVVPTLRAYESGLMRQAVGRNQIHLIKGSE